MSNFTKAINQANEASYKDRKHIINPKNVSSGGWDLGKAASDFFASTPFSLVPTASAEPDKRDKQITNLGITAGDKDSYLVSGGPDMQNKVMTGFDYIMSLGEAKKPPPTEVVPVSQFDPTLQWYDQYAQKYPSMFIPKPKHAGVQVPTAYKKQLDKYAKIVNTADRLGQQGPSIDKARQLHHLYQGIVKSWYTPHTPMQTGMTLEHTHTGDPQLYSTVQGQEGERVIITQAEKAILQKVLKNPENATQSEIDQAAMIQAKQTNTYVQFQSDSEGFVKYDQSKDTISVASDPLRGVMGYGLTPFIVGPDGTSDENRKAWEAEGGTNMISSYDAWLKESYTDQGMKIPWWYSTRDRIEMVDTNKDGTPDMLNIVPYETDVLPRFEEFAPEEMPQEQFVPAEPYEVPYYVDVEAASVMLEGGQTFESIMEKPPLSSEYMYWTDPSDNKEYVMAKEDHQEYVEAVAHQKKVQKQQKHDEIFMDITRGRGPVIPQPIGKRRGASAGASIQRVMSGTAPSEADIGGLVK